MTTRWTIAAFLMANMVGPAMAEDGLIFRATPPLPLSIGVFDALPADMPLGFATPRTSWGVSALTVDIGSNSAALSCLGGTAEAVLSEANQLGAAGTEVCLFATTLQLETSKGPIDVVAACGSWIADTSLCVAGAADSFWLTRKPGDARQLNVVFGKPPAGAAPLPPVEPDTADNRADGFALDGFVTEDEIEDLQTWLLWPPGGAVLPIRN
jgi:hypothetical protein